ncbi:lipid droplet assembly factor 1 isoform X3 [Balaenoptera ricei]|nr:lipid droplet assembly factor 1 isoform X2 [Balaenoptera ricei]XP_059753964.1 lipid droplet assembly factor 1 isoform X3 [Balaenoptera ricei]
MVKEEPPSTSKDLQELQRRVSLLIASVQSNSKVVAFMKSPVGQYLDRHPFLTLTLLVFAALSAVPVGVFLLLVVLTSLAAFVGVILLEESIPETVTVEYWVGYLTTHEARERMSAMRHLPCYWFCIGKRKFVMRKARESVLGRQKLPQ